MSDVKLILGDCLQVLPTLDAADAAVFDPPYGIGENNHRNMSRANLAAANDYGHFTWDNERANPETIRMVLQMTKEQVIFGGNYYADILPPSSSWIVWDKQNGHNDFADCELAWTSHRRTVRIFRYMWNGMIKAKPEKRYHPTQKPLALMKWVIENYTNPGDIVLDPYMGVGTTGLACVELGRHFVGIEIDETYFNIAQQRIAAAQRQMLLPLEIP